MTINHLKIEAELQYTNYSNVIKIRTQSYFKPGQHEAVEHFLNKTLNKKYLFVQLFHLRLGNCISGVVGSMLTLNAEDRGFKLRSCQTKDYNIGICCFSAKHSALRGAKTG